MSQKFPDGAIKAIHGKCIVLEGDDIDTDRIIPARFLKCVSFKDLGEQVFADDRIEKKGSHPFDLKTNENASILVVNDNFGCGSSREHAPQALMRWGIRAVVGQSFAEIFYGNCLALGIPCATASGSKIRLLQKRIKDNKNNKWILDIEKRSIFNGEDSIQLKIEQGSLKMLLSGRWDATSQLISNKENLNSIINQLPYLNDFKI